MSYPLIEKWLGLEVFNCRTISKTRVVVEADKLEAKLAEGFEVYGDDSISFSNCQLGNTHALAIGKQLIKKQTKEEAALEFVKKFSSKEWNNAGIDALKHLAKEILEMK